MARDIRPSQARRAAESVRVLDGLLGGLSAEESVYLPAPSPARLVEQDGASLVAGIAAGLRNTG